MTKILLVDDSKFLRMATERALGRAGYSVMTADESEKAIELAKNETPDVILLNMLLPGMTGPDVLKSLKKDPSTATIPVIAFTGLSHKNEGRLRQDGACAYLGKIYPRIGQRLRYVTECIGCHSAGVGDGSSRCRPGAWNYSRVGRLTVFDRGASLRGQPRRLSLHDFFITEVTGRCFRR